jgi:hypothetical protein
VERWDRPGTPLKLRPVLAAERPCRGADILRRRQARPVIDLGQAQAHHLPTLSPTGPGFTTIENRFRRSETEPNRPLAAADDDRGRSTLTES